ncbi:MAG: DUF4360 domain-containing protein [Pseudobdellovibrionaceae bacterium]
MKPLVAKTLILVASLFAQGAWAVPTEVTIGNPKLEGEGCPQGTARAVLSPDGSAISILFDEFILDATKRRVYPPEKLKKDCDFKIPVQLPPGYRLLASRIDYRGFAALAKGVKGFLTTTEPAANAVGKVVTVKPRVTLLPQGEDVFTVSHKVGITFQSANCKKNTGFIAFNTELKIAGSQPFQPNLVSDSLLVLDSVDIGDSMTEEGPIRIAIELKECKD